MKKKLLLTLLLIPFTFYAQTIYVDQNASGLNNGSDWTSAYTDLQTAITNIGSNTTINVAQGTYYPTTTSDRSISFNIPSGKKLFGGFPTGGGTRNPALYPTILSGDIGVLDNNTDNSYHVVYFLNTNPSTEIDGFIIEKGYANGGAYESNGGGIFISTENSSIYNAYVRNCIIRNNYAAGSAGGIFVQKKAEIYNCKIYSNQADDDGGGIWISTNGRIYNSYILNNKSVRYGGGIYVTATNYVAQAINCVITNNESENAGAGAYFSDGRFHNCTIVNNSGNGAHFGVYGNSYNTIVWGNSTTQLTYVNPINHVVENNCIQDITTAGTNVGLSSDNNGSAFGENYPRFTKPTTFTGNATTPEELEEILNADWSINPQSAAIDFGDTATYPTTTDTPTVDIIGNNRTINTTMDAGAYEAVINIETKNISNQLSTSATLNGEVLFAETSNTIQRGFVYETSTNFDVTTATSITNLGTGIGVYNDDISGLTESIFYYYKAWAEFDGVKYYGNEMKFNTSNLVAYYPFSGNANDESGNGHHGTVYGATLTQDKDGNNDKAYYFNGISNYIDLGNWESGGAMSFTFWARWDALNSYSRIIDISNGTRNDDINIFNWSTTHEFSFYIHNSDIGNYTYIKGGTIALNNWDFYAATVSDLGHMKIYKNSQLITENINGKPIKTITRVNQFIAKSIYTGDGYFEGAIDELRIYDTALTLTEIQSLHNFNPLKIEKFDNVKESNFYVSKNILYFKDIQNLNEIKTIEIYNLLGQKVFKTSKIEREISLKQLKIGVYVLKVETSTAFQSLKILIN